MADLKKYRDLFIEIFRKKINLFILTVAWLVCEQSHILSFINDCWYLIRLAECFTMPNRMTENIATFWMFSFTQD